MPAKRLRVGVIGVGRMGERHARVYASSSDVEFVGVSDVSPHHGRAVATRYGVPWYEDFMDLLREVDAVSIATPTNTHFEVAAECIAQKVHVLVEKPIAASVPEARNLAWLAQRSETVFQVGHIERYNPVFRELQVVLEDLQIVGLNARRLSPFDTSNTDIDVVFDLMIHDLDLVLTLLGGNIECVQAHGRSARMAAADYVVATLCLADGPLATLTASRLTEQKVRLLEVTALGAYVEADLLNKTICIYRRTLPEYLASHQRPLRYRQEGLVERIHVPTAEPLMLELQDFVRCALTGEMPRVSAEEGVRALELATTICARAGVGAAIGGMSAVDVRPATLRAAS